MINKVFIKDNIVALKQLVTEQLKFNLIYIDPPYNMKENNLLYNDFYSNWGLFMYERLLLSKFLLKRNGVFIISINDIELHELLLLTNIIFKDYNIKLIKWKKFKNPIRKKTGINFNFEYLLIISKKQFKMHHIDSSIASYEDSLLDKIPKYNGKHFLYPKPEKLLIHLINKFTKENDLILDYFAGSGTTGVSADKLKRKFYLVQKKENNIEKIMLNRLKINNITTYKLEY